MWRERQIAATARLVKGFSRLPGGQPLLRVLQRAAPTRSLYRAAVGYRRPFATLAEAKAAIAGYEAKGHEANNTVQHHMELSSSARPSDYPALFHLRPIVSQIHRVFDLGGNAGNLFYCYCRYLDWPSDLRWQVLDLPTNMAAGEKIAQQRGAHALSFTGNWTDASAADLLIVSGSLHYMEQPLTNMLQQLPELPRWILINRTPMTEGPTFATIQVLSGFRLAAQVHNRTQLLASLEQAGYQVMDEWKAFELSMDVPGYPECTVPAYSGAFLQKQ